MRTFFIIVKYLKYAFYISFDVKNTMINKIPCVENMFLKNFHFSGGSSVFKIFIY